MSLTQIVIAYLTCDFFYYTCLFQIQQTSKLISISRPYSSNNIENNNNNDNADDEKQQQDKLPNEEESLDENEKKLEFNNDDNIIFSRPWYFTNGERYPKSARINKKTKKRLAKLTPSEDVRR